MSPRRSLLAIAPCLVALLALLLVLPATRPVAAAAGLTLDLTASARKAKIGDDITFTARVTNTGSEPVTGLRVSLGLPDALDAQSIVCPGGTDTVTDCLLDPLAPGASVAVQFTVRAGSRTANGPVTATLVGGDAVLASASLPPIKIIGRPRPR